MFLLYAVLVGVVAGIALRGSLDGIAALRFRWAWLAFGGFAAQAVLFWGPVSDRIGDAGPAIYVLSTLAVLVAVLRNAAIPGLLVVASGAAANLAAILANGGYMPANPDAVVAAGRHAADAYSNSALALHPALAPLTDVFALPSWLPWANVFSVGDVLIGAGVAIAIVAAMRSARGASRNLPRSPEPQRYP